MIEKKWNYWEVNRGRYICETHGGYCDGCDGYATKCPACKAEKSVTQSVNSVDRILHIINGLQKRSKRNASMATALSGALGVFALFLRISEIELSIPVFHSLLLMGISCLVISIFLYAASMRQVDMVKRGEIAERTLCEFNTLFLVELQKFEWWHKWAGRLFALAVALVTTSVLLPLAAKICAALRMVFSGN